MGKMHRYQKVFNYKNRALISPTVIKEKNLNKNLLKFPHIFCHHIK